MKVLCSKLQTYDYFHKYVHNGYSVVEMTNNMRLLYHSFTLMVMA
jgi:hypothetical protein